MPREMIEEEAAANRRGGSIEAKTPPPSPLDQSLGSSGSDQDHGSKAQPLKLLTAVFEDKIYALRIIADGAPFASPPGYAPQDSFIGNDGNKFYCQVCKELGEIVCCDGCPRAYHPGCIPEEGESRSSLLRDDDPWFCPVCWATKDTHEPDKASQHALEVADHMDEDEKGLRLSPEDKVTLSPESSSHDEEMATFAQYNEPHDPTASAKPPKPSNVDTNGRKRRARAISPKPPQDHTDRAEKDETDGKKIVKRRKKNEPKEVRKRRVRIDGHVERPRGRANSLPGPSQDASTPVERVSVDPLIAALGDRTHAHGLVQATPACK